MQNDALINMSDIDIVENLVLNGDLSKLKPRDKVVYYKQLCERLNLDPLTQPLKLLRLNGKEILYADKGATQQLSKKNEISHEVLKKERIDDVFIVTVRAKDKNGRFTDEDGAVNVSGLKGDALANALMKAVTKAKRRAVLALMGLGMLDETEIETIPNVEKVDFIDVSNTEQLTEKPVENKTEKYEKLFAGKSPEEIKKLYNALPANEKGKGSIAQKMAVFYGEQSKKNEPVNELQSPSKLIEKINNKTTEGQLKIIDSLIENSPSEEKANLVHEFQAKLDEYKIIYEIQSLPF